MERSKNSMTYYNKKTKKQCDNKKHLSRCIIFPLLTLTYNKLYLLHISNKCFNNATFM